MVVNPLVNKITSFEASIAPLSNLITEDKKKTVIVLRFKTFSKIFYNSLF